MRRILVADDNDVFRAAVCQILSDAGFDVVEAKNGNEALCAQRVQPADVILCDIYMPEREGLETIQLLAREFPSAKVIAMSGGGSTGRGDMLKAARHFGASEILYKPFDKIRVLAAIERVLDKT